MLYVIDAFNLVHKNDALYQALDGRGFPAVKDALVRMLARFAELEGAGVVAVFDGSEKGAHRPRRERGSGFIGASKVELIFAEPGLGADRTIIDLVSAAKRPGEITVVSDDKFVANESKRAGAHSLGCRAFLKKLNMGERRAADPLQGEDPRKYRGLTEREVGEWMDYFGFKDNE
ncbi:MAG: NYN domain-containing protein [Planctomycetes bacterium]|nr:NYN domain-containing protein [Planctomycetota bacterium]